LVFLRPRDHDASSREIEILSNRVTFTPDCLRPTAPN